MKSWSTPQQKFRVRPNLIFYLFEWTGLFVYKTTWVSRNLSRRKRRGGQILLVGTPGHPLRT